MHTYILLILHTYIHQGAVCGSEWILVESDDPSLYFPSILLMASKWWDASRTKEWKEKRNEVKMRKQMKEKKKGRKRRGSERGKFDEKIYWMNIWHQFACNLLQVELHLPASNTSKKNIDSLWGEWLYVYLCLSVCLSHVTTLPVLSHVAMYKSAVRMNTK